MKSFKTVQRSVAGALALLAIAAAPAYGAGPLEAHNVREIGLQVFVEKQPQWETQVANNGGRPAFAAQSPEGYPAPSVMTYMSFSKERVAPAQLETVATTAIRTGGRNFGLNARQANALTIKSASYGVLQGYESTFPGRGQGSDLDVHVFLGQAPGKFPVLLTMYTERGKMAKVNAHRQAAWSKVAYLSN